MAKHREGTFTWLKDQYAPLTGMRSLKERFVKKSLDYAAGLEFQLKNPDQLLSDKNKTVKLFDTVMLDDTVSGTIDLKKTMALSVNGGVRATSDNPEDEERAEWLNKMLYEVMVPDIWTVLDNMLDAMVYGYKVGEIFYDIGKDGQVHKDFVNKWIVSRINIRHSLLFDFDYDEYGDLDKLYVGYHYGPQTMIRGKENILKKFLVLCWPYAVDGNWYGQSDLTYIYLQYFQKYQIMRYRGTYLQNFGMPVIEAKYLASGKNSLDTSEKSDLEDMLKYWQDNLYFKNPSVLNDKTGEKISKIDINLLERKATSTDAYNEAILQLNNDIRRRLLVPDNVGFSSQQVGSQAKAQTELQVFKQVLRDMHGKLEDLINPLVRRIERINFGEVENPSEWHFDEFDKRIEPDMLKELVQNKVVDPQEKWLRAYLGIPEITIEEKEEIDEANRKKVEEAQAAMAAAPGAGADETAAPTKNPIGEGKPKAADEKEKGEYKKGRPYIDFEKEKKILDGIENDFTPLYEKIHFDNSQRLVKQVEKKYDPIKKDFRFLDALRISKTELKKAVTDLMSHSYVQGKISAVKETRGRLDKLKKKGMLKNEAFGELVEFQEYDWLDRDFLEKHLAEYGDYAMISRDDVRTLRELRDRAYMATGEDETRILKEVGKIIRGGYGAEKPLKQVVAELETRLREDRLKYSLTIARTNAATAYNLGREIFFNSKIIRPFIEAYQYQAIIDDRTTEFCTYHDGQIIKKDDPQLSMIWPPNHFNCRSTLQSIFIDDKEDPDSEFYNYENTTSPWGKDVPVEYSKPAKDFGG